MAFGRRVRHLDEDVPLSSPTRTGRALCCEERWDRKRCCPDMGTSRGWTSGQGAGPWWQTAMDEADEADEAERGLMGHAGLQYSNVLYCIGLAPAAALWHRHPRCICCGLGGALARDTAAARRMCACLPAQRAIGDAEEKTKGLCLPKSDDGRRPPCIDLLLRGGCEGRWMMDWLAHRDPRALPSFSASLCCVTRASASASAFSSLRPPLLSRPPALTSAIPG